MRAWSRSAMRSLSVSKPTESLISWSVIPSCSRSLSGTEACVITELNRKNLNLLKKILGLIKIKWFEKIHTATQPKIRNLPMIQQG